MKTTMIVTAIALIAVVSPGWAAEIEPADPEGLRAVAEAYEDAMEARDAKAIAALYASDADILDPTGEVFEGRADIEAMHVRVFSSDMNLELAEPKVRVLTPNAVIVDGKWTVTEGSGGTTSGLFTMVAARQDGKWAIHCTRDGAVGIAASASFTLNAGPLGCGSAPSFNRCGQRPACGKALC